MRLVRRFLSCLCTCLVSCFTLAFNAKAQQSATLSENPPGASQAPTSAGLRLTMQKALTLARKNSVVYQAAVTDAGVAREDKNLARDALLPSVNYNNSAIYSQGIGRPPAV